MFANRKAGFAFIHIPKNAGTSVRYQFRKHDDFNCRFEGTQENPVLGTYDGNHVPLYVLREVFPKDFARIEPLDKFAIVRDPKERFASALSQRVRMFGDRQVHDLSRPELEAEIDVVIDHMRNADRMPAREFAHFMRQTDFVELDGTRFVENILPLEQSDRVIAEIARRLDVKVVEGAKVNRTSWNGSVDFTDILRSYRHIYQRVLPRPAIVKARQLIEMALDSHRPPKRYQELLSLPKVADFINSYYARDIVLHNKVAGAQDTTRSSVIA